MNALYSGRLVAVNPAEISTRLGLPTPNTIFCKA